MAGTGRGRLGRVPARLSAATRGEGRSVVVALLGLLGFLVLTVLVFAHPEPLPLDRALHRLALEHREPVVGVAKAVTALGTGPVVLPVLLVASAVWASARRRWSLVLVAPLLFIVGVALRYAAMHVIDRARPPAADWVVLAAGQSFPSGHTTTAALAYGLSIVLLALALRTSGLRLALTVVLLVVAALVGVSRVVLGVHWPTDVLGGWSLGVALVAGSSLLLTRLDRRVADSTDATPTGPAPGRRGV
jgi:membrane-associated phospholipid phosphatase